VFALVLGGGGSAGVGWETGVLYGLAQAGLDVDSAAQVVGTSAGAIVGARLRSPADLATWYEAACRPADSSGAGVDYPTLERRWAAATAGVASAPDARRRIADLALATTTMTPAARRAEVAAMLPGADWPAAPLTVTSVNGSSGALVGLDRDSGLDFVDAVAASCAVPGVWPPVVFGGAPHLDGAVRSPTNADLATGYERLLVIAPALPGAGIERELRRLPGEVRCEVISADAASVAAFGVNPLDPRTSAAAAREGLRQGRAAAVAVAPLLA
jgi:NTE family protein